jgi:hypothetical protein
LSHLDSKTIASKAVDIQKGLQDVSLSVPHYYFNKTNKVAKAIRLAANIQGFEVIRPFSRLLMMGIELGIEPDQLETSILPALVDLDLIEVHKDKSGMIERIEESVPPIEKLLSTTGKYWQEIQPSSIENGGILALNMASTAPIPLEKLKESLPELKQNELDILMDCGQAGKFLSNYESEKHEKIVYSPTIWGNRSDDVLRYYSRLNDSGRMDVGKITEQVRNYPGLPFDSTGCEPTKLTEVLSAGMLEKGTTVNRSGQTKDFLFFPTPLFKLKSSGLADPFDKVKAIISCVRHGQTYAEITPIKYPSLLLQRLLERGYLNPHSESGDQYAILELHGVLKNEQVGGRWKPVLVQSDDNKEAVKTAIEVLSSGEQITRKLVQEEARSLLVSGGFINPVRNRTRMKDLPILSQASLKDMLEMLRGERFEY